MGFSRFLKITSVNLKHNFPVNFVLACIAAAAAPALFGISSLSARDAYKPIEFMLPFSGMFLLTPVFYPEQNENIRDLMRSKKTGYLSVCLIRVICSVTALTLISAALTYAMKLSESDAGIQHFFAGFVSALLLGGMGFLFSSVSGSVTAGYMAAAIFYLAGYGMKSKLGAVCIFAMTVSRDGDFSVKYKGLLIAAVFIFAGFAAQWCKDR